MEELKFGDSQGIMGPNGIQQVGHVGEVTDFFFFLLS